MADEGPSRIGKLIARLYPERQIYVRSEGVVRFVTLRRPAQIAATFAVLAALGWTTFATVEVVLRDQIIEAKDRRISEVASAYGVLERRARDAERRFLAITGEIEAQHRQLVELVAYRTELEAELGAVRGALDRTAEEREQALLHVQDLRDRVGVLEADLVSAGGNNRALAQSLAEAEGEISGLILQRDQALAARDRLDLQVAELSDALHDAAGNRVRLDADVAGAEEQLAEVTRQRDDARARVEDLDAQVAELGARVDSNAERAATLIQRLAAAEQRAGGIGVERDEAVRTRDFLAQLVDELELRLDDLQGSQGDLLLRLNERAGAAVAQVEQVLAMTGLPLDDLLPAGAGGGQGGPIAPMDGAGLRVDDEAFAGVVAEVETRLDRWSTMEKVVAAVPLMAPADNYYVSSNFGRRIDPFTKKPAMHAGLDLAGPMKSPLFAPAPGVVTRAGYWGAYGRMVEIDHGFGIVSRYGHMNDITVNKGDVVEFRQQIGTMGRSGRSTGPHVHFEVLFQGENLDPAKFLQAGRYVFKEREQDG